MYRSMFKLSDDILSSLVRSEADVRVNVFAFPFFRTCLLLNLIILVETDTLPIGCVDTPRHRNRVHILEYYL